MNLFVYSVVHVQLLTMYKPNKGCPFARFISTVIHNLSMELNARKIDPLQVPTDNFSKPVVIQAALEVGKIIRLVSWFFSV